MHEMLLGKELNYSDVKKLYYKTDTLENADIKRS